MLILRSKQAPSALQGSVGKCAYSGLPFYWIDWAVAEASSGEQWRGAASKSSGEVDEERGTGCMIVHSTGG